ncbi:MAG: hypothetical protein FVQ82_10935 [Planctomycetes bacterium]|nr:hypothetical protein [Planctomycetota bacterium]
MNGNIHRQRITADLEAMARVGIGGAQIFNIAGSHGCDIPAGPIDYQTKKMSRLQTTRCGIL